MLHICKESVSLSDEAVESMIDYMLDADLDEDDLDIDELIDLLDNMTLDQIRMLPDHLLNQIM